ncbi:MAG TPA: hypothetical protein VD962_13315 [Rubricoccaceae bacterium]|nr:hypothetical protein [Rubricoccaceae bacterium]
MVSAFCPLPRLAIRFALPFGVFVVLAASLAAPAAQEIPLVFRLPSARYNPLPPGTRIAVFTAPPDSGRNAIPTDLPESATSLDVIDELRPRDDGTFVSTGRYVRTDSTGPVYFVYALTPSGALYATTSRDDGDLRPAYLRAGERPLVLDLVRDEDRARRIASSFFPTVPEEEEPEEEILTPTDTVDEQVVGDEEETAPEDDEAVVDEGTGSPWPWVLGGVVLLAILGIVLLWRRGGNDDGALPPDELALLRQSVTILRRDVDVVRDDLAALRTELRSMPPPTATPDADALRTSHDALRQQVDTLDRAFRSLAVDYDRLRTRVLGGNEPPPA